jgi:hypothetical protein
MYYYSQWGTTQGLCKKNLATLAEIKTELTSHSCLILAASASLSRPDPRLEIFTESRLFEIASVASRASPQMPMSILEIFHFLKIS